MLWTEIIQEKLPPSGRGNGRLALWTEQRWDTSTSSIGYPYKISKKQTCKATIMQPNKLSWYKKIKLTQWFSNFMEWFLSMVDTSFSNDLMFSRVFQFHFFIFILFFIVSLPVMFQWSFSSHLLWRRSVHLLWRKTNWNKWTFIEVTLPVSGIKKWKEYHWNTNFAMYIICQYGLCYISLSNRQTVLSASNTERR